jgi:protein-tyrosine phosphatase
MARHARIGALHRPGDPYRATITGSRPSFGGFELTLLDVPRQHVMADFLLSAELLEPVLEPARRAFVARGGDSETFDSLSGVRPQNLDAAFDEALCEYGSIDGYIERGLGIGVATCGALREAFVEDPVG